MIKRLNLEKYLGNSYQMQKRYESIYGHGDYREKIRNVQKKNRKKYIMCVVVVAILALAIVMEHKAYVNNLKTDEDGSVKEILRSDEGSQNIQLELYGVYENEFFNRIVDLELPSKREKEIDGVQGEEELDKEKKLESQIKEIIYAINKNNNSDKIELPANLQDGSQIQWKIKNSRYQYMTLVFAIVIFCLIYKGRFSMIDREERRSRDSIIMELPEFINKLELLLGAGMVFNTAFIKIVENNRKIEWKRDSYFYDQLYTLTENVKDRNHVLHNEFENFAIRSQVKELIRISNIVMDNINKGTVLREKLRMEGDALWRAQKRQVDEKGRLAETKLVGPLVIMLIILIVITVAPAMLEM